MSFLSRLKASRAAATPAPWRGISSDHDLWHLTAGEVTYHYGDYGLTWETEIALDSRKAPFKDGIRDESYPGTLGKDFDLICLLVNNAAKLERLIEDIGALLLDHNAADDVFWNDVRSSLAALDGEQHDD